MHSATVWKRDGMQREGEREGEQAKRAWEREETFMSSLARRRRRLLLTFSKELYNILY